MENKDRAKSFKKNTEVEEILSLLEEKLSDVEYEVTNNADDSVFPPIFILGCARSGTTVLHQYLVENIKCIYPSNFISRFYYAPYLGGLYYKLFTQLDERGELLGKSKLNTADFTSDIGKTEGIHSPNEFWYFWRKHFKINQKGTIDPEAIDEDGVKRFRRSIYALQNLFEGPFITKGLIANNAADLLESIFQDPIFIYIKRDLFDNARSLYEVREKFFETPEKWYSFYPKDKKIYERLSPEEQVVQQVIDTNSVIESSLQKCNQNRIIEIDYHSFCKNPAQLLQEIKHISEVIEIDKQPKPESFDISRRQKNESKTDRNIQAIIGSLG